MFKKSVALLVAIVPLRREPDRLRDAPPPTSRTSRGQSTTGGYSEMQLEAEPLPRQLHRQSPHLPRDGRGLSALPRRRADGGERLRLVLHHRPRHRQEDAAPTSSPTPSTARGMGPYSFWRPSWRYYGRGYGWRGWDPFWGDPLLGRPRGRPHRRALRGLGRDPDAEAAPSPPDDPAPSTPASVIREPPSRASSTRSPRNGPGSGHYRRRQHAEPDPGTRLLRTTRKLAPSAGRTRRERVLPRLQPVSPSRPMTILQIRRVASPRSAAVSRYLKVILVVAARM